MKLNIKAIILRPSHYNKRGMVFLLFLVCGIFCGHGFSQNSSEQENRSMVLSNQDYQPRNEEEKRMKEKTMQLPPEEKEKMIQSHKAKEMERRQGEEESLYLSNHGQGQTRDVEEDKRVKEKIMRLPEEQRESAIQEYKMKTEREMKSQGQRGMSEEEKQRMSPEDHRMNEMIHELPSEQRGQAVKEYRERKEQEMKREMSSMEPTEEQKRQMTPEDRAMFQKIMQLPPEKREKAAQEYKMQRSNFYRQ